jgi:hypothetical protein
VPKLVDILLLPRRARFAIDQPVQRRDPGLNTAVRMLVVVVRFDTGTENRRIQK